MMELRRLFQTKDPRPKKTTIRCTDLSLWAHCLNPLVFNVGKTDRAWQDTLSLHAPLNAAEASQLGFPLSNSYLGGGTVHFMRHGAVQEDTL